MKTLKQLLKILLATVVILVGVYFLGPKVATPNLDRSLPRVAANLNELDRQIKEREAALTNLRPDNDAQIIWADSVPTQTDYSIVYLHGWSASREEGAPLHHTIAKKYGCNLYLPRLAGHGLVEQEPMLTLTADALLQSAKEAIAIAKQLGKQVIVMGTSTGGTLALHLAVGDPDVAALLLYSPNVEIFDPNAKLLAKPWGLQLARLVKGSDYHEFEDPKPEEHQFWTTKYRVEALTHLQALVDGTMTEDTFAAVDHPVFLGYYYKDEIHQDSTVSVPAMLRMYEQLGTPVEEKRKVAFPNTVDHVITSYLTSKDVASVQQATERYLEEVLGLVAVPVSKDKMAETPSATASLAP